MQRNADDAAMLTRFDHECAILQSKLDLCGLTDMQMNIIDAAIKMFIVGVMDVFMERDATSAQPKH